MPKAKARRAKKPKQHLRSNEVLHDLLFYKPDSQESGFLFVAIKVQENNLLP